MSLGTNRDRHEWRSPLTLRNKHRQRVCGLSFVFTRAVTKAVTLALATAIRSVRAIRLRDAAAANVTEAIDGVDIKQVPTYAGAYSRTVAGPLASPGQSKTRKDKSQ